MKKLIKAIALAGLVDFTGITPAFAGSSSDDVESPKQQMNNSLNKIKSS